MKNQIWVTVSFSVLSSIASVNAGKSTSVISQRTTASFTDALPASTDLVKSIQALDLSKKPTFVASKPCYLK